MEFDYERGGRRPCTDGIRSVFDECMIGKPPYSSGADMVEDGWRVIKPGLRRLEGDKAHDVPKYAAKHMGPQQRKPTNCWPAIWPDMAKRSEKSRTPSAAQLAPETLARGDRGGQ